MHRLAAALLVLSSLAGCSWLEDEAKNQARRQAADSPPSDPPPALAARVAVSSVQPPTGFVEGGDAVEVLGIGFGPGATVTFDDLPATDVVVVSDTGLRCTTPAHGLGRARVVVSVPDAGWGAADGAFSYVERVTVTAASPGRGPTAGGTRVSLEGQGFVVGTEVRFGGARSPKLVLVDARHLEAVAPPLPRGRYPITVANVNGQASLADAFTPFERVHVAAVEPFVVPLVGGATLTVSGAGFVAGTQLFVGGVAAAATPSAGEDTLTAAAPTFAAGTAEGPVDVSAGNDNGSHTLRGAAVLVDETDTTPRVVGLFPPASLLAGGLVRVVGVGFGAGPARVAFGAADGACTSAGDFELRCTVPPASVGAVDVKVTAGAVDVTLPRAVTYVDLRVLGVSPAEGAVAGGTYVVVTGTGFLADSRVSFGGHAASDVVPVGPEALVVHTPAGSAGAADVTVETLGVAVTAPAAFTYYDPYDATYITAGGPIAGAVDVTVVDSTTRARIPDAFVMLGSAPDPLRPWAAGFTDAQGQVTLSGPGLAGPVDVHAAKVGHGGMSYVAVDARRVRLALTAVPPVLDPLPECPTPDDGSGSGGSGGSGSGGSGGGTDKPPDHRALVRGHVYRTKDLFNGGTDTVVVTTSRVAQGVALPDPGPAATLVSQGAYELYTRIGNLVVVALSGTPGATTGVDPTAMGFRPFVYTEASSGRVCKVAAACDLDEQCVRAAATDAEGICRRVYDDIDVVIDTPIDRQLEIDVLGSTVELPATADYTPPRYVYGSMWLDLGSQGFWSLDSFSEQGSPTLSVTVPRSLPAVLEYPLELQVQVYGSSGNGEYSWSITPSFRVADLTAPVRVGPLLRVPHERAPTSGSPADRPLRIDLEFLPADSPAPWATLTTHSLEASQPVCNHPTYGPQRATFTRWRVYARGDAGAAALPTLPPQLAGAELSPGDYSWTISALWASGMRYDHLDTTALHGYWELRSSRTTKLTLR